MYIYIYIYRQIDIYIERERERDTMREEREGVSTYSEVEACRTQPSQRAFYFYEVEVEKPETKEW